MEDFISYMYIEASNNFELHVDYMQDASYIDEKSESRLYIGNLDLKITE